MVCVGPLQLGGGIYSPPSIPVYIHNLLNIYRFLVASLLMKPLCQQPITTKLSESLEQLKAYKGREDRLHSVYAEALDTTDHQHPACSLMALKTPTWLAKAQENLTVYELREAISVEPGRYEFEESDLPDMETILDV